MKKHWQEPELDLILLKGIDVLADSPDESDDPDVWDDNW